jgi:hypothetical protein
MCVGNLVFLCHVFSLATFLHSCDVCCSYCGQDINNVHMFDGNFCVSMFVVATMFCLFVCLSIFCCLFARWLARTYKMSPCRVLVGVLPNRLCTTSNRGCQPLRISSVDSATLPTALKSPRPSRGREATSTTARSGLGSTHRVDASLLWTSSEFGVVEKEEWQKNEWDWRLHPPLFHPRKFHPLAPLEPNIRMDTPTIFARLGAHSIRTLSSIASQPQKPYTEATKLRNSQGHCLPFLRSHLYVRTLAL